MAKVMVSMPDELLATVDRWAELEGTTRSGMLRSLAEAEQRRRTEERRRRVRELMAMYPPPAGSRGMTAEEAIRADRDRDEVEHVTHER